MNFKNVADLKRQPVSRKVKSLFPSGFPVPMGKQMSQKLKFPSPVKKGKK